jgi:hypothetical protein
VQGEGPQLEWKGAVKLGDSQFFESGRINSKSDRRKFSTRINPLRIGILGSNPFADVIEQSQAAGSLAFDSHLQNKRRRMPDRVHAEERNAQGNERPTDDPG